MSFNLLMLWRGLIRSIHMNAHKVDAEFRHKVRSYCEKWELYVPILKCTLEISCNVIYYTRRMRFSFSLLNLFGICVQSV